MINNLHVINPDGSIQHPRSQSTFFPGLKRTTDIEGVQTVLNEANGTVRNMNNRLRDIEETDPEILITTYNIQVTRHFGEELTNLRRSKDKCKRSCSINSTGIPGLGKSTSALLLCCLYFLPQQLLGLQDFNLKQYGVLYFKFFICF